MRHSAGTDIIPDEIPAKEPHPPASDTKRLVAAGRLTEKKRIGTSRRHFMLAVRAAWLRCPSSRPSPGGARRARAPRLAAVDDLAHARTLCDQLGATFCLTYVKGVGAREAMRRMKAERPGPVGWDAGTWSLVVEPGGTAMSDDALVRTASHGTEVVSLLCHSQAHFAYAVDGTTVAAFDPAYPAEETVWGSDPGLLRPLMTALELRTPVDEADTSWTDATPRAVVLAQRITGVRVPLDLLSCGDAIVVP